MAHIIVTCQTDEHETIEKWHIETDELSVVEGRDGALTFTPAGIQPAPRVAWGHCPITDVGVWQKLVER